MISPLWLWPIWLASILLLCLFGGSTALRALLVLLPLLLAASAAVSCLASRRISLRLSSRELAPKRRGVSAELSVKNDSPFPLMQLRCHMTLENRLTGEPTGRRFAAPFFVQAGKPLDRLAPLRTDSALNRAGAGG